MCLQLKSSLGKGRAFIRFCLAHGQLAESLQLCLLNPELTRCCGRDIFPWTPSKPLWKSLPPPPISSQSDGWLGVNLEAIIRKDKTHGAVLVTS